MNSPLTPEAIVNSVRVGAQDAPDAATLADGTYVVVWTSENVDNGRTGVVGQRYTAQGELIGNNFLINQYSQGFQDAPSVAATDDGGFVVVWESSFFDDRDSGNDAVVARRYDANAIPQGDEFQVNVTNTAQSQNDAQVIGLPGGGFAIAYTDDLGDGNVDGVRLRLYDASGTALGNDVVVNTETASNQSEPSIARIEASAGLNGLPGGGFIVTWTSANSGAAGDGSSNGVFAQLYQPDGTAIGTEFQVNTTFANSQSDSEVTGLTGGRFVVTWTDNVADGSQSGIFAQIFEGDGTAVGGEFQVNQETNRNQSASDVIGTSDGGFVVVWQNGAFFAADGSGNGITARRFDADGNAVTDEFIVNEQTASDQNRPALTALANGDFAAVWDSATSGDAGDGDGRAVLTRIFGEEGGFVEPPAPPLVEAVSSVRTFTETELNNGPQLIDADGAAAVSDLDSTDFNGGALQVSLIIRSDTETDFPAQDSTAQFVLGLDTSGAVSIVGSDVRVGGTSVGTIVQTGTQSAPLEIALNAGATPAAVEVLVENLTIANASDDPAAGTLVSIQLTDGAGGGSAPALVDVTILPEQDADGTVGTERQVNTVSLNAQDQSAIAALTDGGYVSIWTSQNQDQPGSNNEGIFAQRYDASGNAEGAEFRVNSTVNSNQNDADVAGLADGGFVIVWFDTNNSTIRLNRYDATGAEIVTELNVETETSGRQDQARVTALDGGGYVVSWTSDTSGDAGDGSGEGVFAQIFNAAGARVGGELAVNTQLTGDQDTAAVSALAGGGFVATWVERNVVDGDGSSSSINMRIFDDIGVPVTGEIRVNTFTEGAQGVPEVATLSNGDFVITWESFGQDGDGGGIYYQRFSATGTAIGEEIRVNDRTNSGQGSPDIIALDTGGFVIGWHNDSTPVPGSGRDVFVQVFDADGTRIDTAVRANTEVASQQDDVQLVALPNGNYVVQWTSDTFGSAGDGNGTGIFQQIFGDPAEIGQSAPPEIDGLPLSVIFSEDEAEAGTRLVASGAISLSDSDSADFDGGTLRIARVVTEPIQDRFNAPDDGTQDSILVLTDGTVSQAGSTISVDGTAVATIVSDGAEGADFALEFLPGATVAAVETLLGALGYQNDSDDPRESRTYSLTLTDGDGGLTQVTSVEIRVTDTLEADAPQRVGDEVQVNSYTPGEQTDAQVTTLVDGGWVVVWTSAGQDGDSGGIYQQRYDADGDRVGAEVQVSTRLSPNSLDAVTTALEDGGWVVVWQSDELDGSGSGIISQRFDANGAPAGAETVVNTFTSSTQDDPSVTTIPVGAPGFPAGGYMVAYTSFNIDGSSFGVAAQRFATDGTPVGAEFVLSTTVSGSQVTPELTTLSDGRIAATYVSGSEVLARVLNADGTEDVAEFRASPAGASSSTPAIGALADGGFVVAWVDGGSRDGNGTGVFAQRYDASGAPQGSEFQVNEFFSSTQDQPAVIGLEDGTFVIAFRDPFTAIDGAGQAVFGQRYTEEGARLDSQFLLNVTTAGNQGFPTISALDNGNFIAVYSSTSGDGFGDGSGTGIFQQIYGDPGDFNPVTAPVIEGAPLSVSFLESEVNAGFERLDTDKTIALGDPDATDFDGGTLTLRAIVQNDLVEQIPAPDGAAQDVLGLVAGNVGNGDVQFTGLSVGDTVSVDGVVVGTIDSEGSTFIITFNSASTVESVEAILGNVAYSNVSDAPFATRQVSIDVTDGDGKSSATSIVDVAITPEIEANGVTGGREFIVNTMVDGNQTTPEAAELAGGGLVVTWVSPNQDNRNSDGGNGVYAQLYTAGGVPTGPEFLVNSTVANSQVAPAVAGTDDGGFVIVWHGPSVDDLGIFNQGVLGQRYDAAGLPQGGEFVVNTAVAQNQINARVSAFEDGGFVVTYVSDNGDGDVDSILSQRFDASGAKVGAETVVNTGAVTGNQLDPDVATLVDGLGNNAGHVIVFTSPAGGDGDGSSNGVFAQRFDAAGAPAGGEFRVNTVTEGSQDDAVVAGLSGGGFVVAWEDASAEGTGTDGIFAQIYSEAGALVGSAFRVNTAFTNDQFDPAITAMADGGFVISWTENNPTDGSGDSVQAQRFTASGVRVDGQLQVNVATSSNQTNSALTAAGDGFLAVYRAETSNSSGDGSSGGIAGRLFETVPSVDTSPTLSDFDIATTLFADDVTATPVIIDPGVNVVEPAGGSFNGGALTVYYTAGETANDQLSLSQADGVVTLAGATVSVNGTAIGTVDGTDNGTNGASLVIALNASATAASVEALIERLAFSSTDLSANVQNTGRGVGVIITDGAGGQSQPDGVLITIAAGANTGSGLSIDDFLQPENTNSTNADSERTVLESALVGTPTLIDPDIEFEDRSGATFNNGTLRINEVFSGSTSIQVSIQDQGAGAGEIGFDGTDVSFEGTVIGAIDGVNTGANNAPLQIRFNADATTESVRALAEALTVELTGALNTNVIGFDLTITNGVGTGTGFTRGRIDVVRDFVIVDQSSTGEMQVNSIFENGQQDSHVSALSDGGYVIVWTSTGQDDIFSSFARGIFSQRYNEFGHEVGVETLVNDVVTGDQTEPFVTGLSNGTYVVSWSDDTRDGSSGGVFAQILQNDGTPVGDAFQINEETSAQQDEAQLTDLGGGRFLAVWTSNTSGPAGDGSGNGIFARSFDATGTPEAGEFQVNFTTTSGQNVPVVTALAGGDALVVWRDDGGADGSGSGIFAQRIANNGSLISIDGLTPGTDEVQVNTTTTGSQSQPSVGALTGGGWVVSWSSADGSNDGVFVQIFAADGTPVGSEIRANSTTTSTQNQSDVIGLDNGGFAVAWADASGVDGSGTGIVVQKFLADGTFDGNSFVVNEQANGTQNRPELAQLANGTLVATWTSTDSFPAGDGDGNGVFQGLFDPAALTPGAMSPVLEGFEAELTFGEDVLNGGFQLLNADGAQSLSDMDSTDFDGGSVLLANLTQTDASTESRTPPGDGAAQDQLGIVDGNGITVSGATVSFEGDVIGTIAQDGTNGSPLEITLAGTDATPQAVEALIGQLAYANTSDAPEEQRILSLQVSDGDGGSTGAKLVTVNITADADNDLVKQGDEHQVNSFIEATQNDPAVGEIYNAAGTQIGYVVAWESQNQDRFSDNGDGIFAQRFDMNGSPVGAEFLVNTHTAGTQLNPSVTGLPTGGFLIAYDDTSGTNPAGAAGGETSGGTFGRFYDENGVPGGAEVLLNEIVFSTQRQVEVTAASDGTVYALYTDDSGADGSSTGVFLREFDSAGVPAGPSIQVNQETSAAQDDAQLTVLQSGDVVVTWTSQESPPAGDGSADGVFARIFPADGSAPGDEFQVNATSAGSQNDAQVVGLADGDFVVVWRSNGALDGSGDAVLQQRFDATGAAVGGEIIVNEFVTSSQTDPYVIALPDGGWVVAWTSDGGNDGNGTGVFGQRFAPDGSFIDGEFLLHTEVAGTQSAPRLVNLDGNAFAAIWVSGTSGSAGDGDGTGIFSQVFDNGTNTLSSDDPVISGLASVLSLDEAAVNIAGQAIAATASIGDVDSANFAGGTLTVASLVNDTTQEQFPDPDNATQDQFGIATTGLVSVSGNAVRVNGTEIGTLGSDGANGAPLEVTFNTSATAADVQAVVRALTYANTSEDPNTERLVAIQLTDGDGGAVRELVTLDINLELDALEVVGPEVQTNAFTAGTQTDSHVARLADGGYVITWTSTNQDGTGDNETGVFAQRYDASGAPVGGEFQVNTTIAGSQNNAQALGLATGGFVIAWDDASRDTGDDNDEEIVFQIFDADGVKVGGEIAVDSPDNRNPDAASLAGFANGDFVIAYHANDISVTFQDEIYVQRYTDTGGAVGVETNIAGTGFNTRTLADVAVQADGTYAVVFQARTISPSNTDVYVQRFAADNSVIGGPVKVNTIDAFSQSGARIAATGTGNYVVVWRSDVGDDAPNTGIGVYAQMLDGAGNPLGAEFLVNEVVENTQDQPDVIALEDAGGAFAIVYRDSNSTDGSSSGVFVQQYDGDGNRIDDPVLVNEATEGAQTQPAIAALAGGNMVISYNSATNATAGDGSGEGIFHRIVGNPDDFSVGGAPVLEGVNRTVSYAENTLNGVPQLIDADGAAAVSDPDSGDFDGGSILVSNVISSAPLINQINAPDDLTQDQLGLRQDARVTISGTDVSVDGTLVAEIAQDGQDGRPFELTLNANTDAEIAEVLVEHLTYRNISDDPLPTRELRIQLTDGDGGASLPALVTVNITPTPDAATAVGGEQIVNTGAGSVENPAIARLPGTDGDFIVVYENSGLDGDRDGLFAQRFDVNGNKLNRDGSGLPDGASDEFQINTTTVQDQSFPRIDAFSDGSFVVVYVDDTLDGSGQGIVFQRFNADGTLAGGETVANNLTTSTQSEPDVVVLDNDRFVVTWQSINNGGASDGSGSGVLARVFDANGGPIGGQFIVNEQISGEQTQPAVTSLNDGGFLVTWQSATSGDAGDGDSNGVFGRRFDADGDDGDVGEFQINTTVDGSQNDPDVAVLADGNLIVTWTDSGADLSSNGVFAIIIAPDGTPITDEFRVNDIRNSSQSDSAVTALDTGGFVVTWTDTSGADGDGTGVFAQQYNASGARVDSQFQVNTTFSGTQNQPDVEALPGGGFVVAWNGSVMIQIYGNEAPTISPVAAEGDEDTGIALDAAIFDAGFFDPDGNTLQEIRIETFPTNGTLALNGVPVFADQVVSRADLLAGNLIYTGNADFNGADSFIWSGSDGLSFSETAVAANITVNPVNDAPGLEAGPNTDLSEGEAFSRQLTLTDPDTDLRTFTIDFGDGSPVQIFDTLLVDPTIGHAFGDEGTYTVTVTVDDNAGESNSVETDSFIVNVVNGNPDARDDFDNVGEDGPASIGDVLINDTDPGNDALSVVEVNGQAANVGTEITLPSGALFTLNGDGSYSYDPNGQFESLSRFQFQDEIISYRVSDGEGGSDTAELRMRINGANDAPVAQDDVFGVNDDSTVTGNVLDDNGNGPDSDVDNLTTLEITALNGLEGDIGSQITLGSGALLTLNADGTFDYDPNGAFAGGGSDSFTYTLEDGTSTANNSDTATVTININGTNAAPVAVNDAISANEDNIFNGSVLVDNGGGADSDANGDPLTVTEVNGDLANVGAAILLAGGGSITVQADGTFAFNPNGAYDGLALGQSAEETFTYTIEDGAGGSASATVTLTVNGANDAPLAGNDTDTTDEDTAIAGSVLGNDSDVDTGDVISVTEINGSELAVGTAVTGINGGTFIINADGTFSYDPGAAFNSLRGSDTSFDRVEYTIEDLEGARDTAFLTVNIDGVNDGPTAEDDAFNVGEDNVLMGNVTLDNGAGPDSDPDTGDIPFIVAVNGAAADVGDTITLPSGALLTLNGSGTFTYDPNGQYEGLGIGDVGADSFTYTLQDEGDAQDQATVEITIVGNNDAPVAVDDDDSTDEDTALSGSVLGNDGDPEGDVLSVSAVNGAAADVGTEITLASGALLTLNSDGTFDYDPNGQFEGLAAGSSTTDTFTYDVTDGNSGFDTGTVVITIDGVNDAPFAGNDTFSTDEETALPGLDLFANNGGGADSDPDVGDVIAIIEVNGVAASVGTEILLASGARLTVNADGSAAYDPNGAFETLGVGDTDQDTFTYTISDGNGGTDTATGRIIVNGVNDDPEANDDILNVAVDAVLTGDVLVDNGNGPDSDIDASDVLSISALNGVPAALSVPTTLASGAVVTLNADGTFSYDQNGAFSGLGEGETANDSFEYTLSDGNGGFDTATVSITIGGSNVPPVAVDDTDTTGEDTAFTTGNVLANDTDANSDTLSVVGLDTTGTLGLVVDNGDGTFDYDPNGQFETLRQGETATDTFSYTVGDGNGGTDTGTVTLTITGVNDGPVAVDDTILTSEDTPSSVIATGNDLDVEGTDLSVISLDTTGLAGTATIDPDGDTISYDPNGQFEFLAVGESAVETFTYTVQDEDGGTDTGEITVTITGVNDAPVANDDAFDTDEDTALIGADVLTGLGADTDVDASDVLTVAAVNGTEADVGTQITLGSGALLTLNADGTFDYDPNGQFETLAVGSSAQDSFTYDVTDSNGGTDTATVTVTIDGLNDAPMAADDGYDVLENGTLGGVNVITDAGPGADTDVDANDVLSVSQVNGSAANVGVQIALASGALVTLAADGSLDYGPNGQFEFLAAGATTTDSFTYEVSDGNGGTDTATVTVTIEGENDAPVFTIAGPLDVAENTTNVVTLTADDIDGDMLTFSITGGEDAGAFSLDPTSGALTFNAPPDFETPGSFDGDNVYAIQVTVSDGDLSEALDLVINVTDVLEGGVTVIQGTDDDYELLEGTEGQDEIRSGGGLFDAMVGGGDADTFVFEGTGGDGRQTVSIADYEIGVDAIDLGDQGVLFSFATGDGLQIYLDGGDLDTVIVNDVFDIAVLDLV